MTNGLMRSIAGLSAILAIFVVSACAEKQGGLGEHINDNVVQMEVFKQASCK